jgi:CDGSH-type Zn-finger protein
MVRIEYRPGRPFEQAGNRTFPGTASLYGQRRRMRGITTRITVTKNGPYQVDGAVPLSKQIIEPDADGESWEWREGERYQVTDQYRLCRCGGSASKPFCDGTHERNGFDGTETAERAPYLEQADVFEGPDLSLTDAPALCAFARFCDAKGRIWNLVEQGGEEAASLGQREAGHCPSGRLVAWRATPSGESEPAGEPAFETSIGVVEDPQMGVSGPLWVRGGIPVFSADGTRYEVRNRVTLCRCGASRNKPFCDGSHADIGFRDDSADPEHRDVMEPDAV